FLPLIWNAAALAAMAWLFGRAIVSAGLGGPVAYGLALVAPFALNMPGMAFVEMEHLFHGLAALVLLLQLRLFLQDGRISPWLVAAVIIGPMFRYEALALSLLAVALVVRRGQLRAGLLLGLGALSPVVLFGLFLMGQGLDPLPSSILAKMGVSGRGFDPFYRMIWNGFVPGGIAVYAALLLAVLAFLTMDKAAARTDKPLLGLVLLAAVAHLAFGQVGWLARYEFYVVMLLGVGLILAYRHLARPLQLLVLVGALGGTAYYGWANWVIYNWNSRAIYLQQTQMARFAATLPDEPLAANDIGRVSWALSPYVLDLWGLASPEARHLRVTAPGSQPPVGWAAQLTAAKQVRYAMIYDAWIERGIGPDWIKVAELVTLRPRGAVGDYRVAFYATDPAFAPALRAALQAFAPSLPPDAELTLMGSGG
ncbi:MAG: hypothetical protein WBA91_02500, partial [Paracoccaceae bacterium]